jgi:Na+/melibiose symporter-like transporter
MNGSVQKNNVWRIGFFAFNNSSSNTLNTLMGFYAWYTQNVLLLGVIMASMIMPMRIFDGITDPIAGNVLDKLNTKFGRYRPYMVIGYSISLIMVVSIFLYPRTSSLPTIANQIIMVIFYAIYIIGFTLQTTATRAGQSVITGDSKQRPWYTLFDVFGSGITGGALTIIVTSDLISTDMSSPIVWRVALLFSVVFSMVYLILAVIGISTRDKPEFYLSKKKDKIRFSEFISLFIRNKPIRRLIYAASSDKLAAQLKGLVMIYFFSNIILMKKINATFTIITALVGVAIVALGSAYAMKKGSTRAFVGVSKLEAISSFLPFLLCLIFIPVGTTSYIGFGFGLVLILLVYGFYISLTGISTNLIFPMLGDITDYELVQSGKFIPGTIASMFSFVDKLISSLAGVFVTIIMVISGFTSGQDAVVPQNEYINGTFYFAILTAIFLIPCLGHVISVLAMRNYPLSESKMKEISEDVAMLKAEINARAESEVTA